MDLAAVIRALAGLAGAPAETPRDVTAGGQPFLWLGVKNSMFVRPTVIADASDILGSAPASSVNLLLGFSGDRLKLIKRMASIDALHREERLLREGWVFVAGTIDVAGHKQRHLMPLLSRPVRVVGRFGNHALVPAGDPELTPLVQDPALAARLEASAEFGGGALDASYYIDGGAIDERLIERLPRLRTWIRDVSVAAGFEAVEVRPPGVDPIEIASRSGKLGAVVGSGLYFARDVTGPSMRVALQNWAGVPDLARSVLPALYGAPDASAVTPPQPPDADVVLSPLPLTPSQREVVRRARRERLTVVSGAPGNGKSHAVIAAALDAVSQGQSVLIATQTDHAAEVLANLLDRHPGPTPVVFGNAERRETFAARLVSGQVPVPFPSDIDRNLLAVQQAIDRLSWVTRLVTQMLEDEQAATRFRDRASDSPYATVAPGAFDIELDPRELLQRAEALRAPARGWFAKRRQRRAHRELRALVRADDDVPMARVVEALGLAAERRAATELAIRGGTVIGSTWEELGRAEDELRLALGAALDDQVRARLGPNRAKRVLGALGRSLRSGRATRRLQLAEIDEGALLNALPLWIGTLRDIDDLLPTRPGMFDLVILDEASQIDQPRAATGLLRGRRAVVVGDPNQLRHVSFLADVDTEDVLAKHQLSELNALLDVRRNSVWDVAASNASVTWLDDHFRSWPHLIEFPAARFYQHPIAIQTRHPKNERADVIDVVRVSGHRTGKGVNPEEVEAVVTILRRLCERGLTYVGVVSPFRAQVEALEHAVLDTFSLEEIERMHLRVGTVHAFQGNERDTVIASLALVPDDAPGSRRFVEDPHLFNVLITRARQRFIVVTGLDASYGGLVGDYLEYEHNPPPGPSDGKSADPWVDALAVELERMGHVVRRCYPVGRWEIDLCVGDDVDAVGLECSVHPAGATAHIERHLELRRAGWRLGEAYASRWDGDAATAAISLSAELWPAGPPRRWPDP